MWQNKPKVFHFLSLMIFQHVNIQGHYCLLRSLTFPLKAKYIPATGSLTRFYILIMSEFVRSV